LSFFNQNFFKYLCQILSRVKTHDFKELVFENL
jgi:hypothetical protein